MQGPSPCADADTENGEEEDGPAAEEGEEESNHPPDDDHDEEPDGHGPAGTPTTGAATTPGGTAPNGTAAPTDDSAGPAPGDPLHMIHSITDATASGHAFSTRPGDWVYEAEAVSFNLSAAHRCLEQTRRNVVALREGNRHRRGSGTEASRSRSRPRSPRSTSDTADRWGEVQQIIHAVLSAPLHSPSGFGFGFTPQVNS